MGVATGWNTLHIQWSGPAVMRKAQLRQAGIDQPVTMGLQADWRAGEK